MTLEQAWAIVELINNDANKKSKNLWLINNIDKAVRYQTECFNKQFLELNNAQRDMIQYWVRTDDEFRDYFECLSGKLIIL